MAKSLQQYLEEKASIAAGTGGTIGGQEWDPNQILWDLMKSGVSTPELETLRSDYLMAYESQDTSLGGWVGPGGTMRAAPLSFLTNGNTTADPLLGILPKVEIPGYSQDPSTTPGLHLGDIFSWNIMGIPIWMILGAYLLLSKRKHSSISNLIKIAPILALIWYFSSQSPTGKVETPLGSISATNVGLWAMLPALGGSAIIPFLLGGVSAFIGQALKPKRYTRRRRTFRSYYRPRRRYYNRRRY